MKSGRYCLRSSAVVDFKTEILPDVRQHLGVGLRYSAELLPTLLSRTRSRKLMWQRSGLDFHRSAFDVLNYVPGEPTGLYGVHYRFHRAGFREGGGDPRRNFLAGHVREHLILQQSRIGAPFAFKTRVQPLFMMRFICPKRWSFGFPPGSRHLVSIKRLVSSKRSEDIRTFEIPKIHIHAFPEDSQARATSKPTRSGGVRGRNRR